MTYTAKQIADFLKGEVEGNPDVLISDFSKIEEGGPGTLSFLANPKYTAHIYDSKADVVLVNKDFVAEKPIRATLIRVDDAYEALAMLMTLVEKSKSRAVGVSSLASVHESVEIGEDVYVAPFVHIAAGVKIGNSVSIHSNVNIAAGCSIGDNVLIYSGASLYEDTVVGDNCIIHANAVIGSDGFGFAPDEEGVYQKIPQMGNVILEDDVEVGAAATIDRATLGSTIISKGVKIDNLVQIAHNVEIGEDTVIASQTGIAGSTKVGKRVMFGGQVGISGHITIPDDTKFGAKAGLANSIKEPGGIYSGYPAVPINTFRRSYVVNKNLPELYRTINDLKKRIEELEKLIENKS